MDNTHRYWITTTYKLEAERTVCVRASHFMEACNRLDEDIGTKHPADELRRKGFIVNEMRTKHKIVKEKKT